MRRFSPIQVHAVEPLPAHAVDPGFIKPHLPSFSIPCGGETFTHLIFRLLFYAGVHLSWSMLLVLCLLFHPSCLQYFMRGGVTYQEVHASNPSHLLLYRPHPSCSQYFMWGRVIYQEVHVSDPSALVPGLPTNYHALQIY